MCLNVVIPENGSKKGRVLKMLAEIKLEKPLLRGTKIKLDKKMVWVDFWYELLTICCFYCDKMGHLGFLGNCITENQYGVWLKAQLVKRTRKRNV